MQNHARLVIGFIRTAAVIVMLVSVMAIWNLMLWLPWQLDAIIAGAASLAFAYKFERGDQP
jgi:hypothetical protein